MHTIPTRSLVLRRFRADDLPHLIELDADPQVVAFITGGPPEFDDGELPVFLGPGFWAAEETATREFVGWFHLRQGQERPPGELELGYRLRRAAWGKGYATQGSGALITASFTQFGAHRVVAETLAVHAASRRVMEKSGMTQCRHFHADWPYPIPGDEFGDVEYEITREQWQALGGQA